MTEGLRTPVLALVFNRPDLTARLIERLAVVQPRHLLVVCDGPRLQKPGEAERVVAVRQLFERLPWRCDVERDYSPGNLGCAERVSSGITWAFSRVEEAIILEDDCLPRRSFFPFCEELLERYRTDARIGSIGGTDFTLGYSRPGTSYYFSRYNLFWGWATWRRAWQHYDHGMRPVVDNTLKHVLRKVFPTVRPRLYWNHMLRQAAAGKVSSWGYRWLLSCWNSGLLGIQPAVHMIENAGMNRGATHTTRDIYGLPAAADIEEPLVHPADVAGDAERDSVIEDRIYSRSPARRLQWLLRIVLRR